MIRLRIRFSRHDVIIGCIFDKYLGYVSVLRTQVADGVELK